MYRREVLFALLPHGIRQLLAHVLSAAVLGGILLYAISLRLLGIVRREVETVRLSQLPHRTKKFLLNLYPIQRQFHESVIPSKCVYDYVVRHGYSCEDHLVTTRDGYVLLVHHITTTKNGRLLLVIIFL